MKSAYLWKTLASWIMLLILIALVGHYSKDFFWELKQLRGLPWQIHLVNVTCILLVLLTNSLMVDALLPREQRPSWFKCSKMALATAFGNLAGPFKAGIIWKGAYLRRLGVSPSTFVLALTGAVIVSVLCQMGMVLLSALFLKLSGPYLLLPAVALLTALLLLFTPLEKYFSFLHRYAFIDKLLKDWTYLRRQYRLLWLSFSLCLINSFAGSLQLYVTLASLDKQASFTACLFLYNCGGLLNTVAFTPGGIGFYEASSVSLAGLLNMNELSVGLTMAAYRLSELGSILLLGSTSLLSFYWRNSKDSVNTKENDEDSTKIQD